MKYNIGTRFYFIALTFLLSACSGGAFHLRESVKLEDNYKAISIQGIAAESELYILLEQGIAEAEGKVVPSNRARSIITISDLKEDKKIVAYTKDRVAREYLAFLRFKYQLKSAGKSSEIYEINLDKTFVYDVDFVLGKAEEERRIKQALRKEAVRLILLRLQYSKL